MPRAVLDTNVVIDALLGRRRASLVIMRALFEGRFRALVTVDVLAEYRRVLHSREVAEAAVRARLPLGVLAEYAEAVTSAVELTDAGPMLRTSDPDDDKFTAASTGAHADFIVSSDPALLDLREVFEARVVTPEDFMEVLQRESDDA